MKTTVALCVLLIGCRQELPRPKDCGDTPVVWALECEGMAHGRHVLYRRAEHRECVYASAAVDGVEGVNWGGWSVEIEGLKLTAAMGPWRLLVTEGERVETVRGCMEEP